ncbi:MAG TPA: tetratricopeptide repeat protein [Chitinophagales bacterium]|nr:tetratricopeptide repeat protein [Chitinophagales bacterium]
MTRDQGIIIGACAVLCIGIYLFADTKKPAKEKPADVAAAQGDGHQHEAEAEVLDIETYINEVNTQITDKAVAEKVKALTQTGDYKALLQEYQKIDKPLAIAYFSVKLAEKEGKPEAYVSAGNYSTMLMQTAPDVKARNYLSQNAIKAYEKAVEMDSATDNKIRLAGAYMEGGTAPMQGVSILLDVVKQDSTNIDALLMLGRFGIISGQYDKAIARLEKILYLRPQNSEALLLMAEAYNGKGDKTKAIELLERCKKSVSSPDAKKEIEKYIESIRKPNG